MMSYLAGIVLLLAAVFFILAGGRSMVVAAAERNNRVAVIGLAFLAAGVGLAIIVRLT